jgi:hypothetical protein
MANAECGVSHVSFFECGLQQHGVDHRNRHKMQPHPMIAVQRVQAMVEGALHAASAMCVVMVNDGALLFAGL